jgi:hypothetical protein
MNHKRIAIDADGVLVDYNSVYPIVWKKAFGTDLQVIQPHCYHAKDQFGVDLSDPALKTRFYDAFDADVWSSMPALPGAVEATHLLSQAGYELVCVTSMPSEFTEARQKNLIALGMPISRVFATGRDRSKDYINPKKEVIDSLQPLYFLDDLLENFKHLSPGVHHGFIDYGKHNSPNEVLRSLQLHHTRHDSLLDFANWLLIKENY